MQEVINIGLGGDDCVERKRRIQRMAAERHMTLSRFMLWLTEEYEKRQARRKAKEAL